MKFIRRRVQVLWMVGTDCGYSGIIIRTKGYPKAISFRVGIYSLSIDWYGWKQSDTFCLWYATGRMLFHPDWRDDVNERD